MAISVKLNVFEGPLDLLLHLIDKNKIDIYDIPIVEITDQYMEYLHSMEKEDLGVMSEFLVMAATLLDIKCRSLLPETGSSRGSDAVYAAGRSTGTSSRTDTGKNECDLSGTDSQTGK